VGPRPPPPTTTTTTTHLCLHHLGTIATGRIDIQHILINDDDDDDDDINKGGLIV